MNLHKNIRFFRRKNKLTQEKLSELVSCSVDTLQRWENGTREPKASDIVKLCKILHCTELELLNGLQDNKVELVLSWDWEEIKKGEINMDINRFKVILGEDGKIGLQGAGMITSRTGIEEFLGRVRNELEIALEAQIKRGAIQPSVQGA